MAQAASSNKYAGQKAPEDWQIFQRLLFLAFLSGKLPNKNPAGGISSGVFCYRLFSCQGQTIPLALYFQRIIRVSGVPQGFVGHVGQAGRVWGRFGYGVDNRHRQVV